jgi:hypothetical protein
MQIDTDILEKNAVSTFSPEVGDSMFLQNVGTLSTRHHSPEEQHSQ